MASPRHENTLMESLMDLCAGQDVALVGNAKSITNSGLGPTINSHPVVCRVNQLPIYADDQGIYTHALFLSAWNSWRVEFPRLNPRTIVVKATWYPQHNYQQGIYHPHTPGAFIPLSIYKEAGNLTNGHPSHGLVAAVALANHTTLNSLTIYGFDGWKSGTLTRPEREWSGPHDYTMEQSALRTRLPKTTIIEGTRK